MKQTYFSKDILTQFIKNEEGKTFLIVEIKLYKEHFMIECSEENFNKFIKGKISLESLSSGTRYKVYNSPEKGIYEAFTI